MKNIELNRYDMKVLESYIINIEKLKFRKLVREYELHDNPVEVPVIKHKKVKPKVVKYRYKGENKAYVDYLLESTFKGWRA